MMATTIPVVPGGAGGGSFKGEKKFKPKKEFVYRLFVRTSFQLFRLVVVFGGGWLCFRGASAVVM